MTKMTIYGLLYLIALRTVFLPMPSALAIASSVKPKVFNSFALAENLRYNAIVCSTGIIIRALISAEVRIGCRRVRHIF